MTYPNQKLGAELPNKGIAAEDSYNVLPAWVGQELDGPLRESMVLTSFEGITALRKGPWKYIEGVSQREGAKKEEPELYNIENDISETEDRILEYPKIQEDLQFTLDKIKALGAERLFDK